MRERTISNLRRDWHTLLPIIIIVLIVLHLHLLFHVLLGILLDILLNILLQLILLRRNRSHTLEWIFDETRLEENPVSVLVEDPPVLVIAQLLRSEMTTAGSGVAFSGVDFLVIVIVGVWVGVLVEGVREVVVVWVELGFGLRKGFVAVVVLVCGVVLVSICRGRMFFFGSLTVVVFTTT